MIQKLFTQQIHKQLSDYICAIAWSPDSQTLAVATGSGEVVIYRKQEWQQLQPETDLSVNCLDISYDGRYLATGGQDGNVKVWDLQTQEISATLNHSPAWIDHLAWSPTENLLAFGANRQVIIWDFTTETPLNFTDSSVFGLTWHPTGNHLAGAGNGGVKVWERQNWQKEPYFLEVPGASVATAWSTAGKYLAAGNLDRTISVLAWENPPPWLMQGFPGKVGHVAWSGEKPLLASACQEGLVIWQRQGEGWGSYVLAKHESMVSAIAFSPDSSLLTSTDKDGTLYLWQNAKKIAQTIKMKSGFSCLAWSPTGNHFATGGQTGELTIWQKATTPQGFGS